LITGRIETFDQRRSLFRFPDQGSDSDFPGVFLQPDASASASPGFKVSSLHQELDHFGDMVWGEAK
jgi:hypothetical protein